MEELKSYFEKVKGLSILATADAEGKVNAAVYSRPHFMNDTTVAFIMRDRLTHRNIQSNPHAAFLFVEEGPGYIGRRLYLTKVREEENSELIDAISRREYATPPGDKRFLVFFSVDKILPLIGEA